MSTSEAGQETTCEVEELRRQMAELRRELAQHQSSQTQASKLGWAREPGIDFLAHAGEMGERIRAFDWASTSLGAIENWPESLRTAMSLCLKSPFPTLIYWGSEFLYIYNDAQIPVVGNRHPHALGRPFKEARPEIWPVVRPIVEDVLATGKAARVDDLLLVHRRSGYLEEEYDTCCYTPIMQESGEVGGIFTVVTTTTERVIAQRRLRTRRDLAALNAQGKGAEEVCRMVAQVLAGNPYDIPFALLYLVEDGRQRAQDCLLFQRQPRVSYSPDPAAGSPRGPTDAAGRGTGSKRSGCIRNGTAQCVASPQTGQFAPRLFPPRGQPSAGGLRTRRPGCLDHRSRERLPRCGRARNVTIVEVALPHTFLAGDGVGS
jgi:hypothetical protein